MGVVVAAAMLWPAGAAAARKQPWATINVCDTAQHPNVVGIRASMPGSGNRGERMFIRILVQYLKAGPGTWHPLGPDADSGFVAVGSSRAKARQLGRNFILADPPARTSHIVRGFVRFEWRRDGDVVRSATRLTRAGRPGTVGADPPAFSAATCEIR
jgi:hypothetical protein